MTLTTVIQTLDQALPIQLSSELLWIHSVSENSNFFETLVSICQTPVLHSSFPSKTTTTTTTLTCFWIWRNPPHVQIEVIRARKDVLLRIKIKALYHKVSPELCYFTIDLVPSNQKWEKKDNLHHSLHFTDQFTFKWGWSTSTKMLRS